MSNSHTLSIKICGIGVISAIGIGYKQNLHSLMSENCGIGDITLFDTSVEVPVGEVKCSNSELKRLIGVSEQKHISRTALLGVVAAKEALDDAQIAKGKRVGLISSTTVGGMDLSEDFYKSFLTGKSHGRLKDIVGHKCSNSTEFIAEHCGISGFRTTISTACSSAANAIIMGAEMLNRGMLDYVVVGGVDALCRFTLNGFNSLMILDKQLCRPLDKRRKGLNIGEGAGYIVLTKDEFCKKTYGTLSGYANTNDAYHQTASSENGEGAYRAMMQAIRLAGLNIDDIDYINLHGTGTQNNDSSELTAIKRVFGDNTPTCSSTKSFTGHTLAAAGGIEAVFSILSVYNNIRYANLRLEDPADNSISLITKTITGIETKHTISNSFGFGGSCSSLIFSKKL